MAKKYKTTKGFVSAILKLAQTEPKAPIKGRGYEREDISAGRYTVLSEIAGKNPHIAIVFARRSKTAYNPMQFGRDTYVVSKEMHSLIDSNLETLDSLARDLDGYKRWSEATAL